MKALLICNLIFLFLLFNEKSINAQLYPCNIDGSASFCGEQDISIRFNCGAANIEIIPSGFTKTTSGSETIVTGHINNSNNSLEISLLGGHYFTIQTYYKPHPSITTSVSPICENSSFTISSGESAETYLDFTWDSPSSVITTENSKTIPSASTIHSGYYTLTVNNNLTTGCSASISKNITIVPKPAVNSTTNATRCGTGSVTLGASISAGTINWYNSDGSSAGTGASLTIPSLSSTTTFYVDATNNGCTSSPRIPVIATINPSPTISDTKPGSRCGAGTINLEATASAGVINWYSASTGGSIMGTGVSFLTPSITSTTSYFAEAKDNNCSSARSEVVATINTVPVLNSCTNISLCGAGDASLSASFVSGTESGATVKWYSTQVGGSSVSSANPFQVFVTSTVTYYVEASNANCTSQNRSQLIVNVNQKPIINDKNVYTLTSCGGTNNSGIRVRASGGSGKFKYLWKNGGSFSEINCVADSQFYTVTITDTITNCSITDSIYAIPDEIPGLKKLISKNSEDIEDLKSKVTALTDSLAKHLVSINNLKKGLSNLNDSLVLKSDDIDSLYFLASRNKKLLDSHSQRIKNISDSTSSLNSKIQLFENNLTDLSDSLDVIKSKLNIIDKLITNNKISIDSLKNEQLLTNSSLVNTNIKVNKNRDSISILNTKTIGLGKGLTDIKDTASQNSLKIDKLAVLIDSIDSEIADLKTALAHGHYTSYDTVNIVLLINDTTGVTILDMQSTDISIDMKDFTAELKIYPNPASQKLNIESSFEIALCKVSDISGKVLFISKPSSNKAELNIASLNEGIYILTLELAKGGVITGKVVLKKK